MSGMFESAGNGASSFNIEGLDNWDTSNVTTMANMFMYTGQSSNWSLDCRKWNVNKVTNYTSFNVGVTSKVTPPNLDN